MPKVWLGESGQELLIRVRPRGRACRKRKSGDEGAEALWHEKRGAYDDRGSNRRGILDSLSGFVKKRKRGGDRQIPEG